MSSLGATLMASRVPHGLEHWRKLPVRAIFRLGTGPTILREDLDESGEIPVHSASTDGLYFGRVARAPVLLLAGDLVITARGTIGVTKLVDEPSTCTQTTIYAKRRNGQNISTKFIWYYLTALRTELFPVTQTAIPMLTGSQVGEAPLLLPPLEEQGAIVDFLDRETAKIDALIEKQNELIGLLQERRQRAIKNLVLGRDFFQCRPSSQWFGSVPEHWATPRISHHHDVVLGRMINASMNGVDDIEIPYLAAGSIQPEELLADDSKTITIPRGEVSKYTLKRDDIVVVEGGAGYGRSHVLRRDLPGWAFQNHVARVRGRTQLWDARYLRWVVETCRLSGFFVANNRTATLPSLSRDVLGALRVPRPPLVEQRHIADRLDQETARIDALIAKAEEFISLARERRAALITATVTGQIDVAGEAG